MVLHQGLSDFNKFAGEIFASDLPLGFDYYAMGHYHDHIQKNFPEIENHLVAYPGSLDLGHNEPISDVEKGFLMVDVSNSPENVTTQWIKIEKRRLQISHSLDYGELDRHLKYLLDLSMNCQKKPILDLKVKGAKIDPKMLSGELSKLNDYFLYYAWNTFDEESVSGNSYDYANDFKIDKELSKLVLNTLKSENLTNLSLDLVQMINDEEQLTNNMNIDKGKNKKIVDYLWKYYENNKKNYQEKDDDSLD